MIYCETRFCITSDADDVEGKKYEIDLVQVLAPETKRGVGRGSHLGRHNMKELLTRTPSKEVGFLPSNFLKFHFTIFFFFLVHEELLKFLILVYLYATSCT